MRFFGRSKTFLGWTTDIRYAGGDAKVVRPEMREHAHLSQRVSVNGESLRRARLLWSAVSQALLVARAAGTAPSGVSGSCTRVARGQPLPIARARRWS